MEGANTGEMVSTAGKVQRSKEPGGGWFTNTHKRGVTTLSLRKYVLFVLLRQDVDSVKD